MTQETTTQCTTPAAWRETLYLAAINCSHVITDDQIVLHRDPAKDGNALSQMADRLAAEAVSVAAERPSAASSAADQWIFDLAAEHELRGAGLFGNSTFSATGLLDFARAIAAHLASQSQAAQPSELTDEQAWKIATELFGTIQYASRGGEHVELGDAADAGEFARAAIAAHLAGTSQATKAQAEPILLRKKFFDLPLGTRFRYVNGTDEWVSLERHGCGKVAACQPPNGWLAGQSICSFAESEKECRSLEVDVVLAAPVAKEVQAVPEGFDPDALMDECREAVKYWEPLRAFIDKYDAAPTAQEVTQQAAPEEVRNSILEEAAEKLDAMNDLSGDAAAYDQREQNIYELEREHAISACAAAIRALRTTSGKGGGGMICGTIHGEGMGSPPDENGCHLSSNHKGPHEYVATDGVPYQWETDLLCDCDHCMKCEGDYCTTYWPTLPAAQAATDKPKE